MRWVSQSLFVRCMADLLTDIVFDCCWISSVVLQFLQNYKIEDAGIFYTALALAV